MSQPFSGTTRAVRAALESDTQQGAVIPPIHLTSTFAFESFGEKRTYDYTRSGNPTRDALGEALAELEGGTGAVVTTVWRYRRPFAPTVTTSQSSPQQKGQVEAAGN